jgi:uncharacterized protein YjbI with pentapeptide repeats
MQEPLSTLYPLESENKCPDALWMQLEGLPVEPGSTETQQIDLYLSVNFNAHWEPLLGGRVKFGLTGGKLRLKLENGEMPLATRELSGLFDLCFQDVKQQQQDIENQSRVETAVGESKPGVQDKPATEKTTKQIAQSQLTSCQVSTEGSEANPTWLFGVKTGKPILKGLLKKAKLGTLNVTGQPWRVEATFEVSGPDVHLTDAEDLWHHDISPNKHAVLERKLILFLLETKLKPYLSRVQLRDESSIASPSLVETGQEAIAPQTIQQLQDLIQRISQAKTNNFLELAEIAGLNPVKDFAGGNLLGTSLSGLDFSGANLCRANLRGAELDDADLSEANLSETNLGGADLSGAYLANTDLSYTDLHRASLALANLSGANLTGANLSEANLSNTNLSSATVKDTRFGNNPGISEEEKLKLKQRGAIFEN